MNKRHHSRTWEIGRNIILISLAIITIVIFFNLDIMNKGESVFSRSATTELKFSGSLAASDYTDKEQDRLRGYLKTRKKIVQEINIQASPQDNYKTVKPTTYVLFEVHVIMKDGFTFSTPVRRTKRKDLSLAILAKLDKDVQAYLRLKKEGKKAKTLINTM